MIGTNYQAAAIQAVLGPGHSPLIPSTLWGGWLDGSLSLLEMTGLSVSHDVFGETGTGVSNTETIDAGLCPSTTPSYFGLFDAASSGDLVAYAPVTFGATPAEDDELTFPVAGLSFNYTEA